MTTTGGFDPSSATGALLVEHCDIPVGMTLTEWRRCGGRSDAGGDPAEQSTAATTASGARKPARLGFRRALRLA